MHESAASIAIVGPGAIGTTVAAALSEAGRPFTLYGRRSRDELRLRHRGQLLVVPGPVRTAVPADRRPVDVLFLAVKTTQVPLAVPTIKALVDRDTVLCTLQNGVEQESALARYGINGSVLPSVVWFPAQNDADETVVLRGDPRLTLPEIPAATTIVNVFRDTFFTVDIAANFVTLAWRKLLQNAVAGLMVLTGRRAGMFARVDISTVAEAYLAECLLVARAEGAHLSDDTPAEIIAQFQTYPTDMGTSILADREARRPLEWDVRNAVIMRRARAHGIPTPISDVLVPLLAAASDGPG